MMKDIVKATTIAFRACPFCRGRPSVKINSDSASVVCILCGAHVPDEIYTGQQHVYEDVLKYNSGIRLATVTGLAKRWNGQSEIQGDGAGVVVYVNTAEFPVWRGGS